MRVEPARLDGQRGLAVIFEGTEGLHYYASKESAPPGYNLKVEAKSGDFGFSKAVFPEWSIFHDPLGNKVEVYAGRFTVFVPIKAIKSPTKVTVIDEGDAEVRVSGIACTDVVCLPPFEKTLLVKINWAEADLWETITLETTADVGKVIKGASYPIWFAFGLAFLAGLSLNIMPCVWPVLPLIVMRLVQNSGAKHRTLLGLAFCCGILLFFACLAGANIILQIFYGTVLQWGDQFRSPAFVAGMALLLLVLALFMFDVFTVTVPSSVAGKSGSGTGYTGTVGMGFLAAVLSTPCSFAILAAAFAWAQTQPLPLATVAIMVIGVGMAVPYAILTSIPGLLKHIPGPGRWMQIFKQTVGFILLGIAVWFITALPAARRPGVLYFSVVLAFCVWMWGGWVDYNTRPWRKWTTRVLAAALAITAGWLFLPLSGELIDWQPYDAELIQKARTEERPVLIKFTANWCLSCQVVEKKVYGRADIAKLIEQKGVLAIKADTTVKDYPATLALKDIYNEPGVPVSILFLPGRKEPVRWRGKGFGEELKSLLEKVDF